MCVAILLAIIVVGKMFGGSLKGLIPLSMCISSGLFLYMKEIVRSGREVEWKSEKDRGKYVSQHDRMFAHNVIASNASSGHCQPTSRVR